MQLGRGLAGAIAIVLLGMPPEGNQQLVDADAFRLLLGDGLQPAAGRQPLRNELVVGQADGRWRVLAPLGPVAEVVVFAVEGDHAQRRRLVTAEGRGTRRAHKRSPPEANPVVY